jgi:formate dehydrogenase iron-sulfur subunit
MASGVLYDGTRCIGCRACSVACKSWNRKPDDPEKKVSVEGGIEGKTSLSAKTLTFMRYREVGDGDDFKWAFAKIQCMHCLHPACETACIVGALKRDEEKGAVVYDRGKCIGCRYCMIACPFGIPTYEWEKQSPWIRKCTFCADRQHGNDGEPEGTLHPACVTACPTDALEFGERDELIEEAHRRIEASKAADTAGVGKYVDHVYGEEEVGGTSWMYISPVPFEDLDLPQVSNESVPRNARKAMGTLPYYAMGVIGLMAGIYWVTKRRQKVAAGEHEKKEG